MASFIEYFGLDYKKCHFWTLGFHDSKISVQNDLRSHFAKRIYFLYYELTE